VIDLLRNVVAAVRRFFAPHVIVAAENLLLRHQLIVLRRSSPRHRLQRRDRWLIATLATRTHSLLEAVIVELDPCWRPVDSRNVKLMLISTFSGAWTVPVKCHRDEGS
jgi:hypothetical protein